MNFFEEQRRAKQETNRLLLVFITSVISVSIAIGFSIIYLLYTANGRYDIESETLRSQAYPENFLSNSLTIAVLIFFVILLVSFIKTITLQKKPEGICEAMGARLLNRNNLDLKEKQLINIVEEMSIASGTPVPKIYVLKSDGINAFAAGFDINNAAICVTSRTLEVMNRDELSGIIGHEFSHILNGDMKLNLKLMGMVSGLMFIYYIGARILGNSNSRSRSRSNSKDGGGVYIVAIVFMLLGGLGWLLTSLLKSMISRKREYLADASSVQFTRNPLGIAGALKKIYANGIHQGLIKNAEVANVSHMFFVNAVKSWFSFSTHPPLLDRIAAVDNHFSERRFLKEEVPKLRQAIYTLTNAAEEEAKSSKQIDSSSPEEVLKYLTPIFGFLVQLKNEGKSLNSVLQKLIRGQIQEYEKLNVDEQLKFLGILAGTLKTLSSADRTQVNQELINIIKEDNKISYNEFVIYAYLKNSLLGDKEPLVDKTSRTTRKQAHLLLSYVYYLANDHPVSVVQEIETEWKMKILPKNEIGYLSLIKALGQLRYAKPADKESLIKSMKKLILSDQKITDHEKTILYLAGQCLGVPTSILKST